MITINAGPCWAFAVDGTPEEAQWLRTALTFADPGAFFSKGPPTVSLIDGLHRFPAGLSHMVRGLARDVGIEVKINWSPGRLTPKDLSTPEAVEAAGLSWLRPFQLEAVQRLILATRGLVDFPVGAGKTEVLAGAVKACGGRWVLIAHSAGLVEQGAERVNRRTGIEVAEVDAQGVVKVGKRVVREDEDVVIPVTQQWLHRNLKFVRGVPVNTALDLWCRTIDGLCVDEAHRCGSPTMYEVVMRFSGTSYRLGLSGSLNEQGPLRAAMAVGAIGVTISKVSNSDLIDAGYVSSGNVHMIPVGHPPPRAGTWAGVYLEQVVRSKQRAEVVTEVIRRAPKPALVFVDDLANGHLANTAVNARAVGVKVASVEGSTPQWMRAELIKKLRFGEYDVIVCTEVFQEGVDIPELASVVVATGGKSAVAAIQRMGRATRRTDAKSTFELYDIFDYTVGTDHRSPGPYRWVEKHARARALSYAKQGHNVKIGPIDGPCSIYHSRWKTEEVAASAPTSHP